MRKNNLKKIILSLTLIISGPSWAQMIYEIKDPMNFTTVVKEGNKIGDQFKIYSPDEGDKVMAIGQLKSCDPQYCLYVVRKIRKGVVLQSGFKLEKATPVAKKIVSSGEQTSSEKVVETSASSGKKWVGLTFGAPLPSMLRAEFGLQNLRGSNYDLGINLGMLPASLGGIDLSGQTLGVNAQYRVQDYVLFWNVIPKFMAEVGVIKADLDLSGITKKSGDTNSVTAPYGLAAFFLSQQFQSFFIDLGVGYSLNLIETPQVAPSKNEVSTPFAGSISLLMINASWMF